jgi:hypothetical protein
VQFSAPIEIKIPVDANEETPVIVTIEREEDNASENAGEWLSTEEGGCDSEQSTNQLITFANQGYVSLYSCGEYIE